LILISDGDVDPGAIDLKKTMESEEKVVVFSDSTPWDAAGMLQGWEVHQLRWIKHDRSDRSDRL
jgi:hypothetical protein